MDLGEDPETNSTSSGGGRRRRRSTRRNDLEKRIDTGTRKVEVNADEDLVLLSHPPDAPSLPSQSYVYNSQAGEGVTIYILDTGANTNSPVSPDASRTRLPLF